MRYSHSEFGRFGAFYVIPSCIWSDPAGIATPLCKRCMCGLRTVPANNPGASYCGLQLVFTPLFTPPSGPPWKAHKGTFGLSRHPNELSVSNRCLCRYRHRYTRSAPTRFGHSRNFFFNPPPWGPMLSSGAVGGVKKKFRERPKRVGTDRVYRWRYMYRHEHRLLTKSSFGCRDSPKVPL